ncbi:MAG TPA: methylated-DNA--[protein]-cysteine S-methyltransferase [Myxococcota bacterium]|nr:methylated-DNA--[protein]-cysteine S-methyltransferase [Myxococcota bacterium]
MTNIDLRSDSSSLEARLRRAPASPDRFERARGALAARAVASGLVDVAFARHASPLGTLILGVTSRGVVRVGLPAEGEDAVLDDLARRVSPRVLASPADALDHARRQLDEYFAGRRRRFELPLDWRLAQGFRRAVLRATARIPYGRTASYREVAARAGSPAASRAAGSALANNPLPLLVPCHRVLPSSGALGDYRGGADAKARLLALEGAR